MASDRTVPVVISAGDSEAGVNGMRGSAAASEMCGEARCSSRHEFARPGSPDITGRIIDPAMSDIGMMR